jgi:hypothetical protein
MKVRLLLAVIGTTAAATMALAAPAAAAEPTPAAACAASRQADAVTPDGASSFNVRTNYGAAVGSINWTSDYFHISGRVVDTQAHPSETYAWVHWESKAKSGCAIWSPHSAQLAKATNGTSKSFNQSHGDGTYLVRNANVEVCSNRHGQGWTCRWWW